MGVATRYKVPGWSGAGGMTQRNTLDAFRAIRFALPYLQGALCSPSSMTPEENANTSTTRPAYRWPYFAGAFLVLGIVIGLMWTLWSIRMTTEQRKERENLDDFGHPQVQSNQTNQGVN